VQYLYDSDESSGVAGNFLSGMQRYFPNIRRHWPTGWAFLRNWRRLELPARATPLTPLMCRAFMGACVARGRIDLAALIGLGFVIYLRVGELVGLKMKDLVFGVDNVFVSLPSTKMSSRRRAREVVECRDPRVVELLRSAVANLSRKDRLFQARPATFRNVFRCLLEAFGLQDGGYRPYSLRRGGASWHFSIWGSLDYTMHIGRWLDPKTAKLYIEDAVAQRAEVSLSYQQLDLLRSSAVLLADYFPHPTPP